MDQTEIKPIDSLPCLDDSHKFVTTSVAEITRALRNKYNVILEVKQKYAKVVCLICGKVESFEILEKD